MRYVGAAAVARWIEISPASVSIYRNRYAETDHPCPEPDVIVQIEAGREVPGWLPEREEEWREWARTRVGPGVGGGRPPKTPAGKGKAATTA
ncbi:hypothetical protein [Nonomuraea cypriaca]|uniref:hypothetical protein n=1 Tax=Nonomuraea cypriaca TaxID=1187855 RepID=UPI001A9CA881|nr:hypothetical protein [Nonomuraea cypriaca]